jgi:hypothetical protein
MNYNFINIKENVINEMSATWSPDATTNITVVYNNQSSLNNQFFVVSLPSSILIEGSLNVNLFVSIYLR